MRKTAAVLITLLLITGFAGTSLFNLACANPYLVLPKYTYVSPPEGTEAPTVSIQTPQNNTFQASSNVTIAFNVAVVKTNGDKSIIAIVKLYYEASWKPNETIISEKRITNSALSLSFSDIPDGHQSVTIYALGTGSYLTGTEIVDNLYKYLYYDSFNKTGSSIVYFTVDTSSPNISILPMKNATYGTDIQLAFTANEPVLNVSYALDDAGTVTVAGNSTLSGLPVGLHNVTVYAWDAAGNVGASETVSFTVAEPESFPTVPVVAVSAVSIIAVTAAGLLLYNRKRRKEAQQT